jgi:geranylgeranyl diphosphate synthase, type II
MLSQKEILHYFESQLEKFEYGKTPDLLYKPIYYIMSLGGKRLRPTLLLAATQMYKGNLEKAFPAALSIETFHNFTLLHDDIMDKSKMRRGKATVNTKWNDNVAILSGDTMFAKAYEIMNLLPSEYVKESFRLLTQTAIEVCEGQQYDMDFETQENVGAEEYLKMIRLKTAVLLATSLKLGALLADADAKEQELCYQLGEELGMAFQLKDDSLDVFGNQDTFGKRTGLDIVTNKKTYLYIKAFELADSKQTQALEEAFNISDEEEKIKKVTALYLELEIDKMVEKLMFSYYEKAYSTLENLNVPLENKSILSSIINKLVDRQV